MTETTINGVVIETNMPVTIRDGVVEVGVPEANQSNDSTALLKHMMESQNRVLGNRGLQAMWPDCPYGCQMEYRNGGLLGYHWEHSSMCPSVMDRMRGNRAT